MEAMDGWKEHFQKYLKDKVSGVRRKYYEVHRPNIDEKVDLDVDNISNGATVDKIHKNSTTKVRRSEQQKKKLFDLSPNNVYIAEYCQSLVGIQFYGEIDYQDGKGIPKIAPPTVEHLFSLAEALKGLDEVLRTVDDDLTGYEEEFEFYVRVCELVRNRGEESQENETLLEQSRRFIKVYKRRGGISETLAHNDFWATHQQLLAGKVIADWVDPVCGPMDPIFGVLLNPTAGRTGPGDSGFVHKLLFDEDGPVAYHSAVHDGFGYLFTHHGIGPGYDYLGAWSLFDSSTPLSGQLSGIKFWKKVLKKSEEDTNEVIRKE